MYVICSRAYQTFHINWFVQPCFSVQASEEVFIVLHILATASLLSEFTIIMKNLHWKGLRSLVVRSSQNATRPPRNPTSNFSSSKMPSFFRIRSHSYIAVRCIPFHCQHTLSRQYCISIKLFEPRGQHIRFPMFNIFVKRNIFIAGPPVFFLFLYFDVNAVRHVHWISKTIIKCTREFMSCTETGNDKRVESKQYGEKVKRTNCASCIHFIERIPFKTFRLLFGHPHTQIFHTDAVYSILIKKRGAL